MTISANLERRLKDNEHLELKKVSDSYKLDEEGEKLIPLNDGILAVGQDGTLGILIDGQGYHPIEVSGKGFNDDLEHDLITPTPSGKGFYFIDDSHKLGRATVDGLTAKISYFSGYTGAQTSTKPDESSITVMGKHILIGHKDNTMTVIDTRGKGAYSKRVKGAIAMGYIAPNSRSAYVASDNGELYKISSHMNITRKAVLSPPDMTRTSGIDINEVIHVPGQGVYAVGNYGLFAKLTDNLETIQTVATPDNTNAKMMAYDGISIYVATDKNIHAYNPNNLDLINSVETGGRITSIAAERGKVYVGVKVGYENNVIEAYQQNIIVQKTGISALFSRGMNTLKQILH